jgi:hypothetical protein
MLKKKVRNNKKSVENEVWRFFKVVFYRDINMFDWSEYKKIG